jgi:hypothetical protein
LKQYLRPDTLFGPETIERYVFAAEEWAKSGMPSFGPKKAALDAVTTSEEARGIEEGFAVRGSRI